MNDRSTVPDPVHAARVRYCSAAIAQRILAIPPDASKQSRAVRIGKIRSKVRDRVDWMTETRIVQNGNTAVVTNGKYHDQWFKAFWEAQRQIEVALKAGADLAAFLFPSDEVAS